MKDDAKKTSAVDAPTQLQIDEAARLAAYEKERMMLLSQADMVKGEQLSIGLAGEVYSAPELRAYAVGAAHDPDKMYEVYYLGIDKLLDRFLPKGSMYKEQRDMIYEEKNVYLTRGKRKNKNGIRGGDSRMGHPEDADVILDLVVNWGTTSGNMVELYTQLRDLNVSMGYGYPVF